MGPLEKLFFPTPIDPSWSDEQVIQFLDECLHGSPLPSNVLEVEYSNPYQSLPADLPESIWFLVQSNSVKDSKLGFWDTNEEARKIYSSSTVSGWRTTLRYFEGQRPHGKRTNWLMQEYKITREELLDKNKIIKDGKLLCRVFLCSENTSNTVMDTVDRKPLTEMEQKNSVASSSANADVGFCDGSKSEVKEEDSVLDLLPPPAKETNAPLEVFNEEECFSTGDFLELNDLKDPEPECLTADDFLELNALEDPALECIAAGDFFELNDLEDPESHSSSSLSSSCPSKLSDDVFDSLAALLDREEPSSSRYNVTASTSLGCLLSGTASTSALQSSQRAVLTNPTSGSELEQVKLQKPENEAEGATSSTGDKDTKSDEEKKASGGTIKKLKMYFCLSLY